jgi:hypothetical protein
MSHICVMETWKHGKKKRQGCEPVSSKIRKRIKLGGKGKK